MAVVGNNSHDIVVFDLLVLLNEIVNKEKNENQERNHQSW